MSNQELVSSLNSYLRNLSSRRSDNVVTADDAHRFFSKKGYRGNRNARLSATRTVLNESNFVPVGQTPSSRPVAKGRKITQWVG
jgi:hypothetical protein